jgi:hypothetical protein
MIDKINSIICRFFFFIAGILLLLAFLERLVRLFGYTLHWIPYDPIRLIEFSTILIIFVIALLMRQVRELLRK